VSSPPRLPALDILRAVALFGVLVVNLLTAFRTSEFLPSLAAADDSPADAAALLFVTLALQGKAFPLFSFLFGVGLAAQYDSLLASTAHPAYWLARRMGVLLVFGLVHLLGIWNGDILVEYAVVGLLALPFLQASPRQLALASAVFLAAYAALALVPMPGPWYDPAAMQRHATQASLAYGDGGFWEVRRFSLSELPLMLPLHLWVMPRTLSLFLLGMAVWRSGVLHRLGAANAPRLKPFAMRVVALACALVLLAGACARESGGAGIQGGWGAAAQTLFDLANLSLAAGYAAAVLALACRPVAGRILARLAPLGRMALSNYVLQSLVFGFVFFGYGLGYFDQWGAARTLALGVAVYAAQVVFSHWWLARHQQGPLEWLWRTLMYGRKQPMRRRPTGVDFVA
jgi:uncharacterized protein